MAHAEHLLNSNAPEELGISCIDAFLFGNLVPDIYVGYMVVNPTRTIAYCETHFADPGHVPEPRYWDFWEQVAMPSTHENVHTSDLVLGAWAHLVADNIYNCRFNRLIAQRGIAAGEKTRIRKQADFDRFGRTQIITREPRPTLEVLAQAEAFPQYPIAQTDVEAACKVAGAIAAQSSAAHRDKPSFELLNEVFFEEVFTEVDRIVRNSLRAYARGDDRWGARADESLLA